MINSNALGNYTLGQNKIVLSENLLGGGREASAKLATVMSHEGSHYNGNRVEALAHLAGAETYAFLNNKFTLQADTTFSMEMLAGIMNTDNWKENTGDVDHWKMVQNGDGSFGWAWDRDYDFNIGENKITAEEMKGLITRQKLLENQSFLECLGLGGIHSKQDETPSFISSTPSESTLAQNEMFMSFMTGDFENDLQAHSDFLSGTEGFADASIAAQQLKDAINAGNPREVNQYLKQMNTALYAAQNSGLLVKNDYKTNSNNLVGGGTDENPYLSLTGTVYDTCDQGYRFVTEEFYNQLKPNSRGNFPLMNFAENEHIHTDLWSKDETVVTSVDGAIKLNYDDTWGLNGTNYSDSSNRAYLSNHLDASSIDNYFDLFGMEGTNITLLNNGAGVLTGVKAGSNYAIMGNTGISGNPHVDFGIYEVNNKYKLSLYNDTRLDFKTIISAKNYTYSTYDNWAEIYSGLTSNNLLDPSNKDVLNTYMKYYLNKYNTDYSYWKKMNGVY